MSKEKPPITNFNGYFQFLNNDYPTWIIVDGQLYPSVTTAFQAARCSDHSIRKQIQEVQDYEGLKSIVMNIKNPQNWSQIRYKVMEQLIRDKFRRNKEIRQKLKMTEDRQLINSYDTQGQNEMYWGVCKNKGSNCLGKILMMIRQQIKKGNDLERWLYDRGLEKNSSLWPKVILKCWKQEQVIGKLQLNNRGFHTLGSLDTNNFKLQHPSISKSHAVIFFSTEIKAYLVDLQSTGGTLLNGKKIDPLILYQIKKKDQIIFGSSTRKYQVTIDTSKAQQYLQKRSEQIKSEMKNIEGLQGNLSNAQIRSRLGYKVEECIMVDGIPITTSYRALKDLFDEWLKVKSINLLLDNRTGKPVGIALIYAQYPKQAHQLVKRPKPLKINGVPLLLKLLDGFQANKVLSAYKVEQKNIKREKSKSRSRERQRERDWQKNRDDGDRYRQKERDKERYRNRDENRRRDRS